jgi:hypothetical protein
MATLTFTPAVPWPEPQEALNLSRQLLAGVLRQRGVTLDRVDWGAARPTVGSVAPLVLDVVSPSVDPLPAVTLLDLRAAYTTWRATIDAADAVRAAEDQAVAQAAGDDLPKWAQIDAAIDGLANMADVRVFLKRLVAHLRKSRALPGGDA